MNLPFNFSNRLRRGVSIPTGHISYLRLVDIALKNLFYKKLRTGLTIAGVMVGIGAITFLLAFGFGLRDVVTDQVVDSNSIRTIDVSPAKSNLVKLDEENVKRIADTAGVEKVTTAYLYAGKVEYDSSKTEGIVYGAEQAYINLISFNRIAGSLPNFQDNPDDIYLSSSYVETIGINSPEQIVGKEITITVDVLVPESGDEVEKTIEHTGIVSGVIESGGGSEFYINQKFFVEAGIDNVSQLKVLVSEKDDVESVQAKIEALGFIGTSPVQTLEQIDQIFGILNVVFLGFGGIGLIIATLGMFNTLTVSLLERTKEIGLLVALGARHKDVKRLFIVESVGLALTGGIFGIAGSAMLSLVVNAVLNQLAQSRGVVDSFSVFSFPFLLIFVLVVASVILGWIVSYFPAKRAATISPIDALRS